MGELISVIIPVYNAEPYLARCLDSVCNNTWQDLQIICINDGSPDRCQEIIDSYAARDSRILSICHETNKGVSEARNSGLRAARGAYIAFIDSDDTVHTRYFESMIGCMTAENADIVICCLKKYEKGNDPVQTDDKITFRRIDSRTFFERPYVRKMSSGKLYRRESIGNTTFLTNVRIAEDTMFNLSVVSQLENPVILLTDAEMYYYYQHNDSLLRTVRADEYMDIGNWYANNRERFVFNGSGWNWVLPMHMIRAGLSYRYYTRYIKQDKSEEKRTVHLLHLFYKDLVSLKQNSFQEYAKMKLLIAFPSVYRILRIIDDPTMLDWERESARKRSKKQKY